MAKGQIKQKQDTISQNIFESLCSIQCTREEICAVLNVSKDTLLRWCKATYETDFETIFEQKKMYGKMSLRRTMFKQAEKSPVMAIWLSKQHLGMKDEVEIENKSLDKVSELLNKIKEEANK